MRHQPFLFLSFACLATVSASAQGLVPLNTTPSRIVGHPKNEQNSVTQATPNLVEGREFFSPQGIAVDTSVSPPIVYVCDTGNNRVLGWQNAASFNNGQPADLVIGQQDFIHTFQGGPGTINSTGLAVPTGLAVYKGDLYIADTGNNRILRYKKPMASLTNPGSLFPDLFIGQPSLNSRVVNYPSPTGAPSATGLTLITTSNSVFQVNMAFDSAGNLWVTDPGNRRVLRFAASDVSQGGGPLTANLEIGQVDFTSVQPTVNTTSSTTSNLFATPTAIAFDPAGNLYVSDGDGTANLNRILVFQGPNFNNGQSAARIMGVFPPGLSPKPPQAQINQTVFFNASGIFFPPGKVGVVDQRYSRILLFDTIDKWPDPNTTFSPQATTVVGQASFDITLIGNGGHTFVPPPSAATLSAPAAVAFTGTELFVADSGNHRVVVLPLQNGTFGSATRVLGQDRFDMWAPNLIEGREFDFTGANGIAEGGVVIDSTGDTPHLFVADYFNNRVLGFKDVRRLAAGQPADIVIGQQDFNSSACNQTGDPNHVTDTNLCLPAGLVVDAAGNLYVADSGNGRVVRFPAPFKQQGLQHADMVLGQHNLFSKITDPTAFTMASPYGLAIDGNNGLLVSDVVHSRVLLFGFGPNGTFDPSVDSGKGAVKVLGQPDFTTIGSGNGPTQMSLPRHVASDTDGRPYVVDTGNNRVLIWDSINSVQNGGPSAYQLTGFNQPRGIFVNSLTGDIWVTDTNNASVKKFPKYDTLIRTTPAQSTGSVQAGGATIAITQDQYGDLIVADNSNRVSFYFPGLQGLNAGNLLPSRGVAPGMFAAICAVGSNCAAGASLFGPNTVYFADLPTPVPLPMVMGDMQVNFNDTPVPLEYVSPSQINFWVPMGAPTSGNANVEVIQASTGRVYAAGPVALQPYSPAIYMLQTSGKLRQAAVVNADGTVNGPNNPALRGSVISIYATGQGFIPGAPPDGNVAPSNPLLQTPLTPRVAFNGLFTDEYVPGNGDPSGGKFVDFSGLTPGTIGLWQINVHVPANVTPGTQVPVYIFIGSVLSVDQTFTTTINIK